MLWRPRRLWSRQERCSSGITASLCLSSAPAARFETRRMASELSASVTASVPASASAFAPARKRARSMVLGGSSSVMITVRPAATRSRMLSSISSAMTCAAAGEDGGWRMEDGRAPAGGSAAIWTLGRGGAAGLGASALGGLGADDRRVAQCLRHRRDLGGTGAAAAADQAGALLGQLARDAGEIDRVRVVEVAPLVVARIARVWERGEQFPRIHRQAFQQMHGGLWPLEAIHPAHGRARGAHPREDLRQRRAARQEAFLGAREGADGRHVGGKLDLHREGIGHLVRVEEGLEEDHIHAALKQGGDLGAEDFLPVPPPLHDLLERASPVGPTLPAT